MNTIISLLLSIGADEFFFNETLITIYTLQPQHIHVQKVLRCYKAVAASFSATIHFSVPHIFSVVLPPSKTQYPIEPF